MGWDKLRGCSLGKVGEGKPWVDGLNMEGRWIWGDWCCGRGWDGTRGVVEGKVLVFGGWGVGLQDLIEVDHFSNWCFGSGAMAMVCCTGLWDVGGLGWLVAMPAGKLANGDFLRSWGFKRNPPEEKGVGWEDEAMGLLGWDWGC